jgi:tRNA-specific 2-thiouridylase
VVDRQGRVLGRHRGLMHYTVGQRKGLGIAADRPLYVLGLDRECNQVILGYREQLQVTVIEADRFQPAVPDFPAAGPVDSGGCLARIRHRHRGTPVAGWQLRDDRLTVQLAEPVEGAAPGQGLVLYHGDNVLGGGRILTTQGPKENFS